MVDLSEFTSGRPGRAYEAWLRTRLLQRGLWGLADGSSPFTGKPTFNVGLALADGDVELPQGSNVAWHDSVSGWRFWLHKNAGDRLFLLSNMGAGTTWSTPYPFWADGSDEEVTFGWDVGWQHQGLVVQLVDTSIGNGGWGKVNLSATALEGSDTTMVSTVNDTMVAPTAGMYMVTATVGFATSTAGQRRIFRLMRGSDANGATSLEVARIETEPNAAGRCAANLAGFTYLAAGAEVCLGVWQDSGGALSAGNYNCNGQMGLIRIGGASAE